MILYSSHNLYEATDIGTYLILIKDGSVTLFDRISNIKPKQYRVGIKTPTDITKITGAKREGDYFVLNVSSPEEAGLALKKLVENGVLVTEMRQLDNPLQELFETPSSRRKLKGGIAKLRNNVLVFAKRSLSLQENTVRARGSCCPGELSDACLSRLQERSRAMGCFLSVFVDGLGLLFF